MDASYIIRKIDAAEIRDEPFRHVEIDDLFAEDDFDRIVGSAEISTNPVKSDEELFHELFTRNYRIIDFPGCTSDHKEYIKWHRQKNRTHKTSTSCEGFGVVVRLGAARSPEIQTLQDFINSQPFIDCIARKFGIDPAECSYDAGIQKYLDGYEISPHPDTRRKALTFMVNINPSPASAEQQHHTSYLKFKPRWHYVQDFWSGNPDADRCWVPWDWCETVKQQPRNNSIVIFSPSNNTLHAVKANYDHLTYQRTQLYGNLWFKENPSSTETKWEDYVIGAHGHVDYRSVKSYFKKILPPGVKTVLRKADNAIVRARRSNDTHADRNY